MGDDADAAEEAVEPGDIWRDTAVRPLDGRPGRFAGHVPEAWRVRYAFGGVTFAVALRAIEAALGRPDLRPVSAEGTFCAAIPPGPLAVEVEVLRQGRKGAQAQARVWSTAEPGGVAGRDLVVTAVLGAPRAWPVDVTGPAFPVDAPGPEDSRPREARRTLDGRPWPKVPYHDQTDWRLAVGPAPGETEVAARPSDGRTVTWFRFRRPPVGVGEAWPTPVLAVPADILGPAVHAASGPDGFYFVITLQMSVQFFGPMLGEWLCQHTRVSRVADGFATGVAELWSPGGELVALATQTAMLAEPLSEGAAMPPAPPGED